MKFLGGLARAAAAASTVLVLGACSNGTPTCSLPPLTFNVPATITPTLISPAPGATGVSTGPLDVTIGSAFQATALYVQDPSGTATGATNFRQANPGSNDVRIGTFAQLASQTTYKVYATVTVPIFPSACGANPVAATGPAPQLLGSFTTH
ncbi:MAG: hypothetical protein M3N49_08540 [Candidatus Eremiobacteraeota bacterium]|nr:hypothetical protein [Candidatus Eremiobacteraeota bacterium]